MLLAAAQGAGHRTISERCSLPEGTVRRWLRRARISTDPAARHGTAMPGIRRQPDHPSDTTTIPPPPRPPTIVIANVVQAETEVNPNAADMAIASDRQHYCVIRGTRAQAVAAWLSTPGLADPVVTIRWSL
ncbi:MAG: hypothetical protein WCF36_02175 [Candidatus Nanopelagicales bacterium]